MEPSLFIRTTTDKAVYLLDPYYWVYNAPNNLWPDTGYPRNVTINAMVVDQYGRLVPNERYPTEPTVTYKVINGTGVTISSGSMTKMRTGFYELTFEINESTIGNVHYNALPVDFLIYVNATGLGTEVSGASDFKVDRYSCDYYDGAPNCHYPSSGAGKLHTWDGVLGKLNSGNAYFNLTVLTDAGWTHGSPYINTINPTHETTYKTNGGCNKGGACHRWGTGYVLCTDCHKSTLQGVHKNVAAPDVIWPNCANSSCHGRLSTTATKKVDNAYPNCSTCHPISYRDNFTATSQNLSIDEVPQWLDTSMGMPRDIAVHENPDNAIVNCSYCHNAFHNLSSQPNVLACFDCHKEAGNYSTHNGTLSPLTGVNCTSCHNYTADKIDIHNTITPACSQCHDKVNHSTYNVTGVNCLQCHNDNPLEYAGTVLENGTYMVNTSIHSHDRLIPDCKDCHVDKIEHNNTVNCTICHVTHSSPVKYFNTTGGYGNKAEAGNCTTCHQYDVMDTILSNSGLSAPKIIAPMHHSEDELNGSKWNTSYWTNTSQLTMCIYCHDNTTHNETAMGPHVSIIAYNDTRNVTISATSYWCAGCHYEGDENYTETISSFKDIGKIVPPEITGGTYKGNATAADGTTYYEHVFADYSEAKCYECHGALLATNRAVEFVHSVGEGAFGPDCIACHDVGKHAPKRVNVSAMNVSAHADLNKNTSATVDPANKKCWGCHQTGGAQPGEKEHPDRITDPYTCWECHNGTPAYTNVDSAPSVFEHFVNGTDIKAIIGAPDSTTSCLECHNKTELKVSYVEDDSYGSNLSFVSHYPVNYTPLVVLRSWINSTEYCRYCHDNYTVFLADFIRPSCQNITHGANCSACHGAGMIHDDELKAGEAGPDCIACHGLAGSARARVDIAAMNATTSIHQMLNSGTAVNVSWENERCWACHGDDLNEDGLATEGEQPANFHPDKYRNPRACEDCHVHPLWHDAPGVVEHIPMNLNASTQLFTDATEMCWLCHNNSIMPNIDPNPGVVNATIAHYGSTTYLMAPNINTTDCKWCHYVNSNNVSWSTPVDPRKTVGHDGMTNADCWKCHVEGGGMPDSFHVQELGLGAGPDCVACHDTSRGAPSTISVAAVKLSIHRNLNNNAESTTVLDPINKACWACHGTGREPSDHPARYKNPRACDDCHAPDGYTLFNATPVREHYSGGADVKVRWDCYICHKNIEDSTYFYDTKDLTREEINGLISHYGWSLDESCTNCHKDEETAKLFRSDKKMVDKHTHDDRCYYCHADAANLHDAKLTIPLEKYLDSPSERCRSCHTDEDKMRDYMGPGQLRSHYQWASEANTMLDWYDCMVCHGLAKDYRESLELSRRSTWTTAERLAKKSSSLLHSADLSAPERDCVDCHSSNGTGFVVRDETLRIDTYTHYETYVSCKESCHGINEKFHYTKYARGDVVAPGWAGWSTGTPASCTDCHVDHAGESPFNAPNPPRSIDATMECEDCHRRPGTTWTEFIHGIALVIKAKNVTVTLEKIGLENVTVEVENVTLDCVACHDIGGMAPIHVNVSVMKSGVHAELNDEATNKTELTDPISKACWACHGDGTEPMGHPPSYKSPKECEGCHLNQSAMDKYDVPGLILTHYPGAPDGRANTTSENETYTCKRCHKEEDARYHYTSVQRNDIANPNGTCYECHTPYGNFTYKPKTQIAELNHGLLERRLRVTCERCHSPEGVARYHTISVPVAGVAVKEVNVTVNCTDCHLEYTTKLHYPAVEWITCTDCHTKYDEGHYAGRIVEKVNKTYTCAICHNEEAEEFHNLSRMIAPVHESCYECHAIETNFTLAQIILAQNVTCMVRVISPEILTCGSCHNATGTYRFHYSPYPRGSVQAPGWPGWIDGTIANCTDCHTYHGGLAPFNATDVSGTLMGYSPDCVFCHGGSTPVSLHTLEDLYREPHIKTIILSPQTCNQGDNVTLSVVIEDYWLPISGAEYFIDVIGENGTGIPLNATDGSFDGSVEEAITIINTTGLSIETHTIFVHAVDSEGTWGPMSTAMLTVVEPKKAFRIASVVQEMGILYGIIGSLAIIYLIKRFMWLR
ncbi:MAG: multiheme c-type cytochrome [Methanocellales archaeon]|nr:multiheme c-type cytochrome [Methanocellales archaeon]